MLFNFNDLVTKHKIKINGVIHIGAHYGQEHDLYTSVNAKHVIYYEPHPKSYSKLKKNLINKPGVTLVNKALGSSEGIVKMHCSKENSGMSNSILKPKDHAIIYPVIVFDHTVDVEMTTLDKEILSMPDEVKNVLNSIVMDVQGFELEVLKGSIKTLKQINCIFTEVNFRHMYESCPLIDDIDSFLSSFGFKRVETFDTGSGWGDALYLKVIE
jgi:FkbM family methyltransferase